MKAIRSKLKVSNMFIITHISIEKHLDRNYSILYAVTERITHLENKQRFN